MESIAQSTVKKSYTYYLLILLFYILSLVIFIVVSGTTKELPVEYKDLTTVAASSGLTFILVIIFTKWSKLTPNMVGILPGKLTLKKILYRYFNRPYGCNISTTHFFAFFSRSLDSKPK